MVIAVFFSCAVLKKENVETKETSMASNPCQPNGSCEDKLVCHKSFFQDGWYIPKTADTIYYTYNKDGTISEITTIRDILWRCAESEVSKGSLKAHHIVLPYYKNEAERLKSKNEIPSMLAYEFYDIKVRIFGALRGKDAFELALMYASETKEIPWSDYNHGGNTGLNVITYIINPMIKSVGGYDNLSEYLRIDKKKNRSCKWIVSRPNEIGDYEFYYCEIKKAYAEGKIILKEQCRSKS
ncbi:MAG: hypothetical protein IPO92_15575 [Saprospiraceae bacterium]|nr:hypothetical protein [Saprospiraceae bacterium]